MLLWAGGASMAGCTHLYLCAHGASASVASRGVCVCVSAVTRRGTARRSLERPVQAPYFKSKTPTLPA